MTEEINFYEATPRKTREYIEDCLEANVVPLVLGKPAIGKSSIFAQAAAAFGLWMIDHRVSTSAPEDFTGLPEFYTNEQGQRRARFVPFGDLFPLEGDPLPAGFEGWLLFLDEYNSGTKMVQAASYKTILDRMTGQARFHERLRIGAAGNRAQDKAIVLQLSSALKTRVVTINMVHDFTEWLMDVALPQKFDDRIIAYLSWDNEELMNFNPATVDEDSAYNSPRSWETMHKLITTQSGAPKAVTAEKTGLYAGTISSGSAAAFTAFCDIYKELTSIKDILADPEGAHVPREAQKNWAIVSHLIGKADDKTFGDICTYVNRMGLSFRILFFRAVVFNQPKLRQHPDFAKAMSTMAKYLAPGSVAKAPTAK